VNVLFSFVVFVVSVFLAIYAVQSQDNKTRRRLIYWLETASFRILAIYGARRQFSNFEVSQLFLGHPINSRLTS
jgi:hypothetical protein